MSANPSPFRTHDPAFAPHTAPSPLAVDPGLSDSGLRTYVLDTCVVLADPQAVLRFKEHRVVLPLVVIDELDRQKVRLDDVGAAARATIRLLEELGASRDGGLRTPTPLPSGGTLAIEVNKIASKRLPPVFDPATPDNRLLSCCLNLQDEGENPVLVTKDAALRIKAAQLDIPTEDYRADTVHVEEHYQGIRFVSVPAGLIDDVYSDGKATAAATELCTPHLDAPSGGESSLPAPLLNEFVVLRSGPSSSALTRVVGADGDDVTLAPVRPRKVFGISSRDVRQTAALDLLMDPAIPAVSLMGLAGSGKTFLALAAALEQTLEQQRYAKIEVYRPIIPVGKQDLGFLPGDLDEKLAPWMAAIFDTMTGLYDGNPTTGTQTTEQLIADGVLTLSPITFLRGRTLRSSFVIVDEAQNLELPTIKTILTRIGEDSKVVFCGDLGQIDNPFVSPFGGVAALIEKTKGHPLFGHVTLEKSVRSPLAEFAATIL